jgi:exodeoxyribonuclease VII large subunit
LALRNRRFANADAKTLCEKKRKKRNASKKLSNQLSPLRSHRKWRKEKRLAVLREKQIAAAKKSVDAKDESLKIEMASLDALSPLSVLKRGFSITETEKGEILRDAENVKLKEEPAESANSA